MCITTTILKFHDGEKMVSILDPTPIKYNLGFNTVTDRPRTLLRLSN